MSLGGAEVASTGSGISRWLRRFHATTLSGLYRWPREHYRVLVGRTSEARPVEIDAPAASYLADPFLWRKDGQLWLFAEQFLYLKNRARLVAIALDEAFRPLAAPVEIALATDGHASFPLVFRHDGVTYMLPETSAAGAVDLYRCEQMPNRWRLERRLLENVDAVDTVPLYHDRRWWLFTSVRLNRAEGGHRALAIFFCDDLLAGEWQPHPVNAERLYADSPFSWGRCAGPIIPANNGTWLRPFQASRRYYGEALGWMRIEVLTPTEFREQVVAAGSLPFAPCTRGLSPHHLATCGDFFACDVRDRVSYRQDVPLLRRWALRPTVAPFEDCAGSREPVR